MWFRELSYSRLECGVHDWLHIYPMLGLGYFTFLGIDSRQKGTTAYSDSSERERKVNEFAALQTRPTRDTQSLMLRARFLHLT